MGEVQKHLYVLILAGGGGTRLWPMSRDVYPKQYLKLFGNRSLLQSTFDRAKKITDTKNIWVATTADQVKLIKKQLPSLPHSNFSIEPMRRNTGWSQGLAATYIHNQDPEAVIINLASDHLIQDLDVYVRTLKAAAMAAEETKKIITVGIQPTHYHTGYEYISFGSVVKKYGSTSVYKVLQFLKRDDATGVKKVLAKKTGLWNANNYVWRAQTLLDEYKKLEPRIYSGLQRIKAVIGTDTENQIKKQVFQMAESLQIDFILTGRSKSLLTIPGHFRWTDVGDWSVVWNMLPKDQLGNVISAPKGKGNFVGIDSKNNLMFLDKQLITTVGLSNMVIVDTPDALLICPKDDSQSVKKIVEMLKIQKLDQYL